MLHSKRPLPSTPEEWLREIREIDRADELGSGVRNMMKYGKAFGGADPERIGGDVFRMIVPMPDFTGVTPHGEAG
jgi:ATP-dependent DNA helicase RecG